MQLRRRLIFIAIICALLASALELYTFGLHSDFPLRWLRSFFVLFMMVAGTALAIVPLVNLTVSKLMRR